MNRVTPLHHDATTASPVPGAPWYVEKLSSSPLDVSIWFNPTHLQNLFASVQGVSTRGQGSGHHISLCDHFDQSLIVSAWLVPSDQPDRYHIHVKATLTAPFPDNMWVCLSWNGQNYREHLHAGQVRFEDLTPPQFKSQPAQIPTRDFRLWFEPDDDKR